VRTGPSWGVSRSPVLLLLSALFGLALLAGCASLSPQPPSAAFCASPADYRPAAAYNTAAEQNLAVSPFGRPEQGWAIYGPHIAHEVGAACPVQSPDFALQVAVWQAKAGLTPHGGVDAATLMAMKARWQHARPFLRLRTTGVCPPPADEARLVTLPASETYGDAPIRLRPGTAAALAGMVAAARHDVPEVAADAKLLTVVSGYRSPEYDAQRCAQQGNCNGIVRAVCSAHHTGLAVDLALGSAPGYAADASADANRLAQTRTPAYRWLVANAARFGFVNYAFEPWHWEWTGEAP
jgi:D-alanyl-D-alanine carboxypeptidase